MWPVINSVVIQSNTHNTDCSWILHSGTSTDQNQVDQSLCTVGKQSEVKKRFCVNGWIRLVVKSTSDQKSTRSANHIIFSYLVHYSTCESSSLWVYIMKFHVTFKSEAEDVFYLVCLWSWLIYIPVFSDFQGLFSPSRFFSLCLSLSPFLVFFSSYVIPNWTPFPF